MRLPLYSTARASGVVVVQISDGVVEDTKHKTTFGMDRSLASQEEKEKKEEKERLTEMTQQVTPCFDPFGGGLTD